ncbi:MAG: tetratricopeptide repeat protein [Spirochaetaceae bacterium]|nr:tetratricopeptide repeat protein [Spirochaetaceae bacterium]
MAKATRRFLAASKQGHAGAQWELTQDDASAQFHLGMAYLRGESYVDVPVSKDPAEGVQWLRRSAKQHNAAAQFALGHAYDEGLGVKRDRAESVKWHRMAADQGVAQSLFQIGNAYLRGRGVEQNDAEAMKYFRLAADQDHADAQRILELMPAAEQGDAEAQYQVGILYYGDDTKVSEYRNPKALAKAARWFQAAAKQDYADAQNELGQRYEMGEGVPKDSAEAFRWYRKGPSRTTATLSTCSGSCTSTAGELSRTPSSPMRG